MKVSLMNEQMQILEYHIEVNGSEVKMTLTTNSPEAAGKLADTLDARFKSGTVNGISPVKES
jgi:hypothetical protein